MKYIILDYDGTIHDTFRIYRPAFLEAYQWLVSEGRAKQRTFQDKEISCWLGYNSKVMWNSFMPDLAQEYKDQASARIGESMVDMIMQGEAAWYDGAGETLQQLKENDCRLIFLSNCKEAYMDAHRKYFSMDRFFDAYYCCETYGFAPKQEIIHEIRRDYPGDYLAVGDRYSDLDAAKENDIPFIGCLYGFGEEGELKNSEYLAENVSEIIKLVKKYYN